MRRIALGALLVAALAIGVRVGGQAPPASSTPPPLLEPPIKPLSQSYLQWPLPPELPEYGRIDGKHLYRYVDELAAISHKSRDAGDQWWGRITGTPAHAETQQMLAARFKSLGLSDVRL